MVVDREKLYAEVWAEPMTTVAEKYGVSSSFLARVCERLNVPRPRRGHWAQLKAGKAAPQPALPSARPGDDVEWARGRVPHREPSAPQPPSSDAPRALPKIKKRAQHALAITGKAAFEDPRPVSSWRDDGYLRPNKFIVPDIFVSKEVLGRALEVANRIYQELESNGHRVIIAPHRAGYRVKAYDHRDEAKHGEAQPTYDPYSRGPWSPRRPTIALVGSVAIGLTVFEFSENVEMLYSNGEYVRLPPDSGKTARRPALRPHDWTTRRDVPSGMLVLRAYSPYQGVTLSQAWRESKSGDLGSRARTIREELERAAVTIAKLAQEAEREAEEHRKRWEIERENLRRREAERRRLEEEAQRQKQVRDDIEQWRLARDIRDYVDQTIRMVEEAGMRVTPEGPLDLYIRSARSIAERVDPLSKLREELALALAAREKPAAEGEGRGEPTAAPPDAGPMRREVRPVTPPAAPGAELEPSRPDPCSETVQL